jgi:hypothetical protein
MTVTHPIDTVTERAGHARPRSCHYWRLARYMSTRGEGEGGRMHDTVAKAKSLYGLGVGK